MNAATPMTADPAAGASPVMAQYFDAKARQPDALVFFRMGDFYELFFEDAQKASAALGITLTARGQHAGQPIPMAGVPAHAMEAYLAKLVRAGFKVALCEQMMAKKPEQRPQTAAEVCRRLEVWLQSQSDAAPVVQEFASGDWTPSSPASMVKLHLEGESVDQNERPSSGETHVSARPPQSSAPRAKAATPAVDNPLPLHEQPSEALEALQREIAEQHGFVVEGHVHEVRGRCRECRRGASSARH